MSNENSNIGHLFYLSIPYMDGPKIEDVTDKNFSDVDRTAKIMRASGIMDYVVYVGY